MPIPSNPATFTLGSGSTQAVTFDIPAGTYQSATWTITTTSGATASITTGTSDTVDIATTSGTNTQAANAGQISDINAAAGGTLSASIHNLTSTPTSVTSFTLTLSTTPPVYTLSDGLGAGETRAASASPVLADAGAAGETLGETTAAAVATLAEGLSAREALAASVAPAVLSDAGLVSDTQGAVASPRLSDAGTAADSASAAPNALLSDTAIGTEAMGAVVSAPLLRDSLDVGENLSEHVPGAISTAALIASHTVVMKGHPMGGRIF